MILSGLKKKKEFHCLVYSGTIFCALCVNVSDIIQPV